MLIIPLQPVAYQTINTVLNQQYVTLNVYQNGAYVYMDVYVNNALIIGGAICLQANVIVRYPDLGFIGDFAFYDTSGASNYPQFAGLGSIYILVYFNPSELPSGVY
jgi:hypothetical protein